MTTKRKADDTTAVVEQDNEVVKKPKYVLLVIAAEPLFIDQRALRFVFIDGVHHTQSTSNGDAMKTSGDNVATASSIVAAESSSNKPTDVDATAATTPSTSANASADATQNNADVIVAKPKFQFANKRAFGEDTGRSETRPMWSLTCRDLESGTGGGGGASGVWLILCMLRKGCS
jgi:hypothetical protein